MMQLKLIKFFLLGSVCSSQVGKKNAHSLIASFYYQEACVLHTPYGGIIKTLYLQCEVFYSSLGEQKKFLFESEKSFASPVVCKSSASLAEDYTFLVAWDFFLPFVLK